MVGVLGIKDVIQASRRGRAAGGAPRGRRKRASAAGAEGDAWAGCAGAGRFLPQRPLSSAAPSAAAAAPAPALGNPGRPEGGDPHIEGGEMAPRPRTE
jgi:hypothetical protein